MHWESNCQRSTFLVSMVTYSVVSQFGSSLMFQSVVTLYYWKPRSWHTFRAHWRMVQQVRHWWPITVGRPLWRSSSNSESTLQSSATSLSNLGLIQGGGKTWDILPPQKLFLPLKNFHNQNEISQVTHVHNISTFTEWLEVPPECCRIISEHLLFQNLLKGACPQTPLVGTC